MTRNRLRCPDSCQPEQTYLTTFFDAVVFQQVGCEKGWGVLNLKPWESGVIRALDDACGWEVSHRKIQKTCLPLGVLDAFTIGAESAPEQDDLLRRVAAVNA